MFVVLSLKERVMRMNLASSSVRRSLSMKECFGQVGVKNVWGVWRKLPFRVMEITLIREINTPWSYITRRFSFWQKLISALISIIFDAHLTSWHLGKGVFYQGGEPPVSVKLWRTLQVTSFLWFAWTLFDWPLCCRCLNMSCLFVNVALISFILPFFRLNFLYWNVRFFHQTCVNFRKAQFHGAPIAYDTVKGKVSVNQSIEECLTIDFNAQPDGTRELILQFVYVE